MEQLVLLLVIAAISLANWLIDRSAKLREKKRLQKEASEDGQPEPPVQEEWTRKPAGREELEDHMRRMMESFGFPVEESRPAPQTHAQAVVFEEPAPPPQLPRPASATHRSPLARSKKASVASRPRSHWISRLDSPQGLREAIVLREVLGPPKAFPES